jgi:hypothetical protein
MNMSLPAIATGDCIQVNSVSGLHIAEARGQSYISHSDPRWAAEGLLNKMGGDNLQVVELPAQESGITTWKVVEA